MSIRIILCFLFVIGFSIYAYRNWFASLLAAIFLMAVIEHPDMPKSIAGIQGLNPWNFLMLNVLIGWWRSRQYEGRVLDFPPLITVLGLCYLTVVVTAFLRLLLDDEGIQNMQHPEDFTFAYVTSEYLVNCVKWVLPGLLLFDGARSRSRVLIALAVVLSIYFLLAVQVIKTMPLGAVAEDGGELSRLANRLLNKTVGYHRVNLSMMFAGASWAVLTTLVLVQKRKHQLLLIAAAGVISLGQALTGGRAGYATWGLLGVTLCLVRWRKMLPILPLTVLAVCTTFLPGVRDRMVQGFGGKSGAILNRTSDYEITAGRTVAWSYVIPKIGESPVIGYGRQAMQRTGIFETILRKHGEGEVFPHPHNAYLELLLDNGWIGFALVIPFYVVVLWHAFRVLLDRSDPLFAAIGGTACALVLALLFASMGSQTFYPREGSVGMWCAIGLLLRVSVERYRSRITGTPLFGEIEETSADEIEEAVPQPA